MLFSREIFDVTNFILLKKSNEKKHPHVKFVQSQRRTFFLAAYYNNNYNYCELFQCKILENCRLFCKILGNDKLTRLFRKKTTLITLEYLALYNFNCAMSLGFIFSLLCKFYYD